MENIKAIYTKLSNGKILIDDSSVIKASDFYSVMADRFRAELKKNGINWDGSNTTLGALTGVTVTENHIDIFKISGKQEEVLPGGSQIGIDIQLVAELPLCDDFWEDPFYQTNFSKEEIAYCCSKSEPLHSFAGLYAAKEAVVKCSAALSWDSIKINHDKKGKPFFRDYLISISHSGAFAIAVAVKIVAADTGSTSTKTNVLQPKEVIIEKNVTKTSPLNYLSFFLALAAVIYILLKEMNLV